MLSDNGAVFTAAYRNGIGAMESELCALGITFKHARPYHPQTCGKVERFHQTVKKFLGKPVAHPEGTRFTSRLRLASVRAGPPAPDDSVGDDATAAMTMR